VRALHDAGDPLCGARQAIEDALAGDLRRLASEQARAGSSCAASPGW
jgi:hypothetical protein